MGEYKYKEFGSRLKKIRETANIKQGVFADELGISRQSMSNYENGKHCPDVDVLKKMAEKLECSMDYLFGLTEYKDEEDKYFFEQDMNDFKDTLFRLDSADRFMWLNMFTFLTYVINKDCGGKGNFSQSISTVLFTIATLVNNSLTAEEMKKYYKYMEKEARDYGKSRFDDMCTLRAEINNIDMLSFESVSPDDERSEE